MTTETPAAASAGEPAARPLPTDSLDDIELVTTFELEERRVSLAELRALRPGTVMELSQPLNQAVIRILANGTPVGEGHLIAVGTTAWACGSRASSGSLRRRRVEPAPPPTRTTHPQHSTRPWETCPIPSR
ncbi:FliM/FliN family flagellar motor switch protein [Ralstonia mannitolilytica]